MKKLLVTALMVVTTAGMFATDYVVISKNDVNLRQEPSTTAPVVGKGKMGTMMELVEKTNGWFCVINPMIGNEPVWVSASVAQMEVESGSDKPAISLVDMPDAMISYVKTINTKGGSEIDSWSFSSDNPNFWHDEKPGSAIQATNSHTIIRSNGSMQTVDTEYQGIYEPYYLKLTHEKSMFSDSYEKLETPIFVFNSSCLNYESGIFINGEKFEDNASMDEEW